MYWDPAGIAHVFETKAFSQGWKAAGEAQWYADMLTSEGKYAEAGWGILGPLPAHLDTHLMRPDAGGIVYYKGSPVRSPAPAPAPAYDPITIPSHRQVR